MTGIELIAKERKEQIEKHGRTVAKDKAINRSSQLIDCVVALINESPILNYPLPPENWNSEIYNRMICKSHKDRLIIAGALIAAEIDRLQNT